MEDEKKGLLNEAELVRDDLIKLITDLEEENKKYPTDVGDTLVKTMKRFLEVSEAIAGEEIRSDAELESLKTHAASLHSLIGELLVPFMNEREKRKVREMATSIAHTPTAELPSIWISGNSSDKPS